MYVTWPDPIDEFFHYQGTHRLAEQDGQAEAGYNQEPREALSDHNEYQEGDERDLPQIEMRKKGDHSVEQRMDQLQVKEMQQGCI
jgi:hypothetical protein